jgi:hypothetical protein
MRKMNYVVGASVVIYTTLLVSGMVKHVVDESWPIHARFHVMQAQFSAAGMGLLSLFILFTGFKRREPWAWWALLVNWVAMFSGGFWLSYLVTGDGPPGVRTFITTGIFTAWTAVALALTRAEFFPARSTRAETEGEAEPANVTDARA